MRKFASLVAAVAGAAISATGMDVSWAEDAQSGPAHRHDAVQDTLPVIGEFFSFHWLRRPDISWLPLAGVGKKSEDVVFVEDIHVEDQKFLYFAGTDLWPHWMFVHGGILWSPGGLTNEGLTVKLLASGGTYRYISGALNSTIVVGRQYTISAAPGWRIKRNNSEFNIFAGVDYQQTLLLPDDPGAKLRGRRIGFRATIEIWHEPSTTTMLAADGSVSSTGAGNHARLAYGWRLFDRFYLGPELQAYSTHNYRHARIGAHLTASKNYEHEWSTAFGFGQDSDNRSGFYVRFGYLTRR